MENIYKAEGLIFVLLQKHYFEHCCAIFDQWLGAINQDVVRIN